MTLDLHVYTCARTSDRGRLDQDLRSSPAIASGAAPLTVLWNRESASAAYAEAMKSAAADILVFAHCDIFFPAGWFERLESEIAQLDGTDPNWAVAGVIGVTASGQFVGRAWDNSLAPLFRETGGFFGAALGAPARVDSCDEMVLIVRNRSGVSFDPALPGFHLYGTDIALEAERQGRTTYALDLPLIHNAKAQLQLGADYVAAYKYMVRKWRARMPVATTCGLVTANPLVLAHRRLKMRYKALFRRSTYCSERLSDPAAKALELNITGLLTSRWSDDAHDSSRICPERRIGAHGAGALRRRSPERRAT
jgi:hypothetical protein